MPVAPWRAPLAAALHRNRRLSHARYVQLATVRTDGRPANRTVVFRGFLENSDRLQIVTDARSQKVAQVAQIEGNTWGEACWYFPKTREQFRLSGRLILVNGDRVEIPLQQARRAAWEALSDRGREGFAWPPPGQPRAESDAFEGLQPDPSEPLPQFCLLLLDPDGVDLLQLRSHPHDRRCYQRQEDGTWLTHRVNP
ncbi:pyridoxamine 5'-phosphate oxidase family protein [Oscillatoriales cyanobacterium LEGE 11467]|uniref:Pyridoxamine 5'-phosphate oxidase family protein n=1 Tax=Zarconia navalis LEGE 11467 TaxID=1828826 RepID=A0A928VZQ4_9CYAN|nr:Npun_F5749 family FMN-dependent PPOX-type flavoprotein [Zarconia navalis]MBE9040635.1 pyridoxamine 5'-phosphate oxidase family protein [Zarconia navalis LEGE 11467]